jgi:hypothetical protein
VHVFGDFLLKERVLQQFAPSYPSFQRDLELAGDSGQCLLQCIAFYGNLPDGVSDVFPHLPLVLVISWYYVAWSFFSFFFLFSSLYPVSLGVCCSSIGFSTRLKFVPQTQIKV